MSTATNRMKFSEFVDLLLARLYDLDQESPGGKVYFDLNAAARQLIVPVPPGWVFDAGKVLESRGLAQCVFTLGGGCHAVLTGEGRLYVEEERGTGIIHKFHESPQNYVVVSGSSNQVVVGGSQSGVTQTATVERERQPAFELLESIERQLKADTTLDDQERSDLLADVGMIRGQLSKRQPNRVALAALLEPLSKVASIGGFVMNLIKLLNP
jgi:hypothetical protein